MEANAFPLADVDAPKRGRSFRADIDVEEAPPYMEKSFGVEGLGGGTAMSIAAEGDGTSSHDIVRSCRS